MSPSGFHGISVQSRICQRDADGVGLGDCAKFGTPFAAIVSMAGETFKSSKGPESLRKGDRVRFRAIAVHKRTIGERAETVRGGSFAQGWASTASPGGWIRIQNPPGFGNSQSELSLRLNALSVSGGPSRNRTGVQGFAVLCVTTPPSGLGVLRSLPRRSPSGQPRGFTWLSHDERRLA
jgi:hypothetical protein